MLRTLFSRILDPVALLRATNLEGQERDQLLYIDVNPSYEKVMQLNRDLIVGKAFHDVWSESESEMQSFLIQVAKTGEEARYEGYCADAGLYVHCLAFSPLESIVAVFVLDMTEWKAAEEDLRVRKERLAEHRCVLLELAEELSNPELRTSEPAPENSRERMRHLSDLFVKELRSLAGFAYRDVTWDAVKERAERSLAEIDALLQDTRSLTLEAGSPLLNEAGLEAALRFLAERMLTPYGIALDFSESGPDAVLSVNSRLLIYGMTRELLLNVVRHAAASEVSVRIMRGKKRVRVLVEDDGCGFSVDRKNHWGHWSGLGLFGIRERLRSLGGTLRILTEKGQGCSIWLTIPVLIDEEGRAGIAPTKFVQELIASETRPENLRARKGLSTPEDEADREDEIVGTSFE